MRYAIGLIYNSISDPKSLAQLEEVIRSNYVSKKAKDNFYVLSLEKEEKTIDLHNFIISKCKFKPSLLVFRMDVFHGTFSDDFVNWFKAQFPHMQYTD
jgi:hypothetical protein